MKKSIKLTKKLGIDIETTGLDFHRDRILSISLYDSVTGENHFYANPDRTKYLPQEIRNEINTKLVEYKNKGYFFTFQNGMFDLKFLWKELGKVAICGKNKGAVEIKNELDTLVGAGLLPKKPIKLSLDSIVSYFLGIPSWKEKMEDIWADPKLLEIYNNLDSKYTARAMDVIEYRLKEAGRWDFFLQAMEASNLLTEASFSGMSVDIEEAQKLITELTLEAEKALEELNAELPEGYKKVNWKSPKQVLPLFKYLGLDVIHPLTSKESVDSEVISLNKHRHPIPLKLHAYKKITKKITSIQSYITEYISPIRTINCGFNMSNTKTGRLSSSQPNMQQVDKDKKVRRLFVASPGTELVVGDMAQIEVRMAAHYSKDPTLINMFNENLDFYGTIAHRVLKKYHIMPNDFKEKDKQSREVAKVIGLSILYGTGAKRLRNTIISKASVEYSLEESRDIIENYFDEFNGLVTLRQGVDAVLSERGFIVNLMGRQVDVAPSKIYMTGVNALLQSSASDLLLFRQLEIQKRAPYAQLINIVHDEVIYEVPKGKGKEFEIILKEVMENRQINESTYFRVPLKMECEVGNDWSIKE